MKYLGIDYGTKRIGLAISNDDGTLAFPREVIARTDEAAQTIAAIGAEEEVAAYVIGESRDEAGRPNPLQADIEHFARELEEASGLPVHGEPEYMTTVQAQKTQSAVFPHRDAPRLQRSSPKGRKREDGRDTMDASAAALILQTFLDKKQHTEGA